jgi:hypothetical protein
MKNLPDQITHNEAMFRACKEVYLNIVEWLVSLDKVDIHWNNEWPFRTACSYGHFHIAQWLYSHAPTINIHAEEDAPFRRACSTGNENLIKWLYGLGDIDVKVHDSDPIIRACHHGHTQVVKWLYELEPSPNGHLCSSL